MTFEEFVAGFSMPIPEKVTLESKPVEVLIYIKSKGYLAADIDFLNAFIEKHTPAHPDEWEVDEDCIAEIEDFRDISVSKKYIAKYESLRPV